MILCPKGTFLLAGLSALLLAAAAGAQEHSEHGWGIVRPQEYRSHEYRMDQEGEEQRQGHDVNAARENGQQQLTGHTHEHGEIPVVQPERPRLGRAQQRGIGPVYGLDELERMAL